MGKVILDMSMSLDGFIAGANGEDSGLNNWYFAPSTGEADPNQVVIQELIVSLGAIVMGNRTYGMEQAHEAEGGDDPYNATRIVLTHRLPENRPVGETSPIFVTDGIESALKQALAAAGERDVAIGGGANVAQQFLKAGLVDEIQLHLIPVLPVKVFPSFNIWATPPLNWKTDA